MTTQKKAPKRKKSSKKRSRKKPKQDKRKKANRSTRTAPADGKPKYITAPHTATTGRRGTLTDQITQELVAIIQAGNYFITACKAVSLPEATFYSWLERGENELKRLIDLEQKNQEESEKEGQEVPEQKDQVSIEPLESELPYLQFLDAIKKAEGVSEVSAVITVKSHFGKNWQAAMTFLERRYPDRWKKKDRMELVGDGGGPIGMNVRVYIPDNNRGDGSRPGGAEDETGKEDEPGKDSETDKKPEDKQ